jgi:hypothetical protein
MDPNDPKPPIRYAEGILGYTVDSNGMRTFRVKWLGRSV